MTSLSETVFNVTVNEVVKELEKVSMNTRFKGSILSIHSVNVNGNLPTSPLGVFTECNHPSESMPLCYLSAAEQPEVQ